MKCQSTDTETSGTQPGGAFRHHASLSMGVTSTFRMVPHPARLTPVSFGGQRSRVLGLPSVISDLGTDGVSGDPEGAGHPERPAGYTYTVECPGISGISTQIVRVLQIQNVDIPAGGWFSPERLLPAHSAVCEPRNQRAE